MAGNREYKSDAFGMLMEEPGYALEVYNALNHSDYRDPGLVEVCSLERGNPGPASGRSDLLRHTSDVSHGAA